MTTAAALRAASPGALIPTLLLGIAECAAASPTLAATCEPGRTRKLRPGNSGPIPIGLTTETSGPMWQDVTVGKDRHLSPH